MIEWQILEHGIEVASLEGLPLLIIVPTVEKKADDGDHEKKKVTVTSETDKLFTCNVDGTPCACARIAKSQQKPHQVDLKCLCVFAIVCAYSFVLLIVNNIIINIRFIQCHTVCLCNV